MKKSLLWLIITMMCIALLGTFTLAGCKTEAEGTTEETIEETTEETAEETTEEAAEETTEEAAVPALTTDPVKLVHYNQLSDVGNEYLIELSEDFMELYPNVEIELSFYNPEDLLAKIKTTIGAGTQLDLFFMSNFNAAWFLENDVLGELTPVSWGLETVEEVASLYIDGSFDATGCTYNGKYYGVPHVMNGWAAWLNKTHMIEAGLDPEADIPETWDEFVEVAKALTITEGDIITREGLGIINNPFWSFLVINSMMQQKGLDWLTLEGMIEGCDDPGAAEALKEYTDWVLVDKIWDPALTDDAHMGMATGMVSGLVTGGTWVWGVFENAEANLDDYMPIPYPVFPDGEKKLGLAYGAAHLVTKSSENPEWAYKWADFIGSAPEKWIEAGSQFCPKVSLDSSAMVDEVRGWPIFEETIRNGTATIPSSKYAEINDIVFAAIQRVLFDGMSNEDSIAKLKTDLEALQ